MRMFIDMFALLTAFLAFALAFIRVIESINELNKTPELNNIGKIIQVFKNFITVEAYNVGK